MCWCRRADKASTASSTKALKALGKSRTVAVAVHQYNLAPMVVANSDYVCTLPERFLSRFTDRLDSFALPFRDADVYLARGLASAQPCRPGACLAARADHRHRPHTGPWYGAGTPGEALINDIVRCRLTPFTAASPISGPPW